ncbi:hypothetical protein [Clostridium weizhouense]|uniref:hypothetical protein n=1 Tax=Clostridium weizhouense TaxID=2859781 RepID=UPI00215633A0|nr:hypothetical protein [Clostridium weizhouense]
MDFNIGNLVSGVVGGIAKVANAVGNALSAVAKSEGIIGSFAGVAAVLANVCEDGEIDEEEELLEEVFKLLVGALIPRFGFEWSDGDYDDDIPSDHVCYILYQTGEKSGDKKHTFDEQAKIQMRKYEKKYPGTNVILMPVSNPQEFKKNGIIWMMSIIILML